MKIMFLSKGKKRDLLKRLEKQFGIKKPDFLFFETDRETRIFTGSVSKDDLAMLVKGLHIQSMGLYFAKNEESYLRLSLDAIHLLSREIKKNILEISSEQGEKWMNGENLKIEKNTKGAYIIKCGDDLLSSGKATNGEIWNFIPKERRTGNY